MFDGFDGIDVCVDTSVIINGVLEELIKTGKIRNCTVYIPNVVLAEIENMANKKRMEGFIGLDVLELLRKAEKILNIKVVFVGERPSLEKISLAESGELDAMIREIAKKTNSVLLTSDTVQHRMAKIEKIKTVYYRPIYIIDNKQRKRIKFNKPNRPPAGIREGVIENLEEVNINKNGNITITETENKDKRYKIEDIPLTPEKFLLVMKFLEVLISLIGKENLEDVLYQYHFLGYLSEKAILKLLKIAKGIDVESTRKVTKLTFREHMLIINYLQMLADEKVDEDKLIKLEIELRRLKRMLKEFEEMESLITNTKIKEKDYENIIDFDVIPEKIEDKKLKEVIVNIANLKLNINK
ncbi:PIN domain-containing protein [Methanocaldococcus indicus]|uniref:PIN domain-containing protein n=1 Tax=Methanocaldococcus indicus TaxID=213231 RepID=UPI003C6D004B